MTDAACCLVLYGLAMLECALIDDQVGGLATAHFFCVAGFALQMKKLRTQCMDAVYVND